MPFVQSASALERFRNRHKGRRCFVIGNGPSLARMKTSQLRDEVTIGCNMIYKHGVIGPSLNYYMCGEYRYLQHPILRKEIREYSSPIRFFHERHKRYVRTGPRTYFYGYSDGLSTDMTKGLYVSDGTVLIEMLQLALFLGCDPVYLIGVDAEKTGHFTKSYLPESAKKMGLRCELGAMFRDLQRAAIFLNHPRRRIYNATDGGSLELFTRVNYAALFNGKV